MNDPELEQAIAEFTGAFEVVFRQDWDYSMAILHAHHVIGLGRSFIEPDVPLDQCNWGARAALLKSHQKLLAVMARNNLKPALPVRDPWFNYDWPAVEP